MCEKEGYKTSGWDGEDCPLVMCDLISFENGELGGREGGREGWSFDDLAKMQGLFKR